MKIRSIYATFMIMCFSVVVSCKGDDDPAVTEVERVTNLLVGNASIGTQWNISSVTVNDIDYTDEFTGLSLIFSEGSFTATNGKAVFDASDTWSFSDEDAKSFATGSTGLQITIQEITSNKLVLVFMLDESIYGRGEAVAGENIFTFTR